MARPKAADKRRRILEAAVGVFARKGYFAARVSDIAKRAGVADGTIYLYFRNKEDILVRLFDEVMSEHVEEAREAVRALPSAPGRLRAIAERHLAVLGREPRPGGGLPGGAAPVDPLHGALHRLLAEATTSSCSTR